MFSRHCFGRLAAWGRALAALVLPLFFSSVGSSQIQFKEYTAVSLHPAGANSSECRALSNDGKFLVGSAAFVLGTHALLWGPGGAITDLHPSGQDNSVAYAVSNDGLTQAGYVRSFGNGDPLHAARWQGSSASFADLNPTGYSNSVIYGLSADGQIAAGIGIIADPYSQHALLWGQNPIPWVRDLHPAGYEDRSTDATAISADGTTQVGGLSTGGVGGGTSAVVWHSTSESFRSVLSGAWTNYWFGGVSGDGRWAVGHSHGENWNTPLLVDLNTNQLYGLSNGRGLAFCWGISPSGRFQAGADAVWYYTNYHAIVWQGPTLPAIDLQQYLPAQYTESRAYAVDDQGNVCGSAYNALLSRWEAMLWRRNWTEIGTGVIKFAPKVFITSQPWIAKDTGTGRFNIFVETRQTLRYADGTIEFEVRDADTSNLLFPVQSFPVPRGTTVNNPADGNKPWKFDLSALGVPRFTKPMHITVKATVIESGKRSLPASRALVETKIPVLWVRGIRFWTAWDDSPFVSGMFAYGYKPEGSPYPTFFPLEYDPNDQVLTENASSLDTMVRYVTREASPITYAARVDLVAHSKGGLVSRQYIKDFPDARNRIRRLIMACSPHTGAVSAYFAPDMPLAVSNELLPTSGWWRPIPGIDFVELVDNQVLKMLNDSLMPTGLRYYLLYGNSLVAPANLTVLPAWTGLGEGDSTVVTYSQTGFQVLNDREGNISEGPLIRAFDALQGAEPPRERIALPYAHSGFLGQAVDTIYQLLHAP